VKKSQPGTPATGVTVTREAVCRVCGRPFIAKRGAGGCWGEVCKRSECRGAGLFAVRQARLPRAPAVMRPNEIDGGGQQARFRINGRYREWN
jgi:hypothetical protein